MADTYNFLFYFFAVLLVFSIFMTFFSLYSSPFLTGYATSATTSSNVTISTYFAISISTNLSNGIYFGTASTIPVNLLNGSGNYDLTSEGINGTTYWANVSTDSNTPVDFCLSAANNLRSNGGDIIGANNMTYSNSTVSINITNPTLSQRVVFTTTATKASQPVAVGSAVYYRFWLNIPTATPAGSYNNTITVGGVSTGTAC